MDVEDFCWPGLTMIDVAETTIADRRQTFLESSWSSLELIFGNFLHFNSSRCSVWFLLFILRFHRQQNFVSPPPPSVVSNPSSVRVGREKFSGLEWKMKLHTLNREGLRENWELTIRPQFKYLFFSYLNPEILCLLHWICFIYTTFTLITFNKGIFSSISLLLRWFKQVKYLIHSEPLNSAITWNFYFFHLIFIIYFSHFPVIQFCATIFHIQILAMPSKSLKIPATRENHKTSVSTNWSIN